VGYRSNSRREGEGRGVEDGGVEVSSLWALKEGGNKERRHDEGTPKR